MSAKVPATSGRVPSPEAGTSAQVTPIAGAPITSRLADQPLLQPIVRKFVGRLRERLHDVTRAEASGDLVEISGFSHWLKGLAGSMGYDYFTEPAVELEKAAKAGDRARTEQLIGEIRLAAERIVVPGEKSPAT